MLKYPQSCFAGLLGINGTCTVPEIDPVMMINQIPSVNIDSLALLAGTDYPTGQAFGVELIESASRFVSTDVGSIYDAAYKVVPSLVNGCSACSYSTNSGSGNELGIMVKNVNSSSMARLIISSLLMKTSASGTYNVVINDGATTATFEHVFTSGVEYELKHIDGTPLFSTRQKSVRIYMLETVSMPRLSCPGGSGCGCSGKVAHQSDLVFTGTSGGSEAQQAFGFLPCAYIGCNSDDLLCSIAKQAPSMVALAMLYKVGELYFQYRRLTTRNTSMNSTNPEELYRDERHWGKLYTEKLNGLKTRGLKDVVNDILRQSKDACITCDAKWQTAYATG
jgi:hypothetical protein